MGASRRRIFIRRRLSSHSSPVAMPANKFVFSRNPGANSYFLIVGNVARRSQTMLCGRCSIVEFAPRSGRRQHGIPCSRQLGFLAMCSLHQFNAFAASRGEGLHPRLRALLERTAASPFSEVTRHDGLVQAGPDPGSEIVSSRAEVVRLSR
jgi:hypothetical protein